MSRDPLRGSQRSLAPGLVARVLLAISLVASSAAVEPLIAIQRYTDSMPNI